MITIRFSPLTALTLIACMVIYCADVWLFAFIESGPPPGPYSTKTTAIAPVVRM